MEVPSVQLRRLPEVLGARRDHGVAAPSRGHSERARPGSRTWRWRPGPWPGPRRRAPGPGAGRGRDYELGHRARGGEAHAAVLVARGDGAGLRRRVGRREPGAALLSRQDHRRRLRAGSEPLPEDARALSRLLRRHGGDAGAPCPLFPGRRPAPRMRAAERALRGDPAGGDLVLRLDGERHADITADAGRAMRRRISARWRGRRPGRWPHRSIR